MVSLETLRDMIMQPSEEPGGAKKKGVRSASEIVKDKKDSQYFATFLAQCGDSDEVKEAYRKQLAHEPLTGEELALIGEAVRQFEESIKIANELHDKIYRSPYFEGFFNTFVEKYNHVVTAKQFKDTLLNHLHLLAVTGGDAIKEFANTFDAYTKAMGESDYLDIISERIRREYGINNTLLSGFIEEAKNTDGTIDKNTLKERIKNYIWKHHPDSSTIFNEDVFNEDGTAKSDKISMVDRFLRAPGGKPIEKSVQSAGVAAAENLVRTFNERDGQTNQAITLFTEALSEISQTGKTPERPKKYSARGTMEARKDVKVGEEEIRKKREEFKTFKEKFHEKHPGYSKDTNEDTMLDVFLQEQNALYDTKMNKGKKVGWLERFLRTVRDTYIKGKIKTS